MRDPDGSAAFGDRVSDIRGHEGFSSKCYHQLCVFDNEQRRVACPFATGAIFRLRPGAN